MKRRQVLSVIATGLAAFCMPAFAQQEKRVRRIAYLGTGTSVPAWLDAFRQGMAELRWLEGRDYVLDARYADGVSSAGPRVAGELVATQPDLLLTSGDVGTLLLAQRTKTLPIVYGMAVDPVANGLAASLQRPGGNVTGLTILASDLGAKRMQLLKEAFPRVAHVGILFELDNPGSTSQIKVIEHAAKRLGMRATSLGMRQAADLEPAFKRATALDVHAYQVIGGVLVVGLRQAIADRILRSKVPAMFGGVEYVEAGGLMSYAPSIRDSFRRAATYADKILKGAKPGDLPIEQPMKFEMVVNMKTAKAMGFTIPQSILLRADRVIE